MNIFDLFLIKVAKKRHVSEQSVRTTSVPKLESLSQDDLELRENTGGLRVTLENLTKEEGRLCTCWCQVKIYYSHFMFFWRNVQVYWKYWQLRFTQSTRTGPNLKRRQVLIFLLHDDSVIRSVALHMENLKFFSFLKKYMEKC